ncbi:hypothetical protein ALC56_09751 [Trachymyrmex septentrionalis]|uniref:Uncharacterized protein n=1 Tax=Trachymyrmex septentrionalis TaxID=34720 RepID=A0A195F5U5_9HYME|nr:hypothetical protein ALC56_09751 [Trachymyrmex septentrionalis]
MPAANAREKLTQASPYGRARCIDRLLRCTSSTLARENLTPAPHLISPHLTSPLSRGYDVIFRDESDGSGADAATTTRLLRFAFAVLRLTRPITHRRPTRTSRGTAVRRSECRARQMLCPVPVRYALFA